MLHIELLMKQVGEKRIAFWLTDKLIKGYRDLSKAHFYLETFNILEIETHLYQFGELNLNEEPNEPFFMEIDILKSEFDISIYLINSDEEDKRMRLKKLSISSGFVSNGYAEIKNCLFLSRHLEEVSISNININSIEAIGISKNNFLKINYSTINTLSIEKGFGLDLKNSTVDIFKIGNSLNNNSFSVVLNSNTITNIWFNGANINTLEINKTILKNGKILDCIITKFILEDSDLGDLNFINISFSELVRIVRSYFEKIKMLNIKWHYYFLDDINIPPGDIKDTYRQLKYVYDNSGNITEANKFFAKEMEYYMKSLKEGKDWKNYGIALIQKKVSDFGNDWILALFWYFVACILGFSISILSSLALWGFFDFPLDLGSYIDRWNRFLMYINPIPKLDEVTSLWYLLVSVVKLLLVYQVTVALRRISQR